MCLGPFFGKNLASRILTKNLDFPHSSALVVVSQSRANPHCRLRLNGFWTVSYFANTTKLCESNWSFWRLLYGVPDAISLSLCHRTTADILDHLSLRLRSFRPMLKPLCFHITPNLSSMTRPACASATIIPYHRSPLCHANA